MALSSTLLPFIFLATRPWVANAALYTSSSQLPQPNYDYIVVGGGTAGSVIAARLTEDPNCHVLVLEAGGSDNDVLAASVPFLGPAVVPGTIYDWNYTITPQSGLDGRAIPYPRGRMLGGSSSVNYMVYTRGPADEWNKYADIAGDPGWRWDHLQSYIPLHERVVPPTDGRDMNGLYTPSVHGTRGVVAVNPIANERINIDKYVIDASHELGGEFSFNQDMNGGNILGMGSTATTTGGVGNNLSDHLCAPVTYKIKGQSYDHILGNLDVFQAALTEWRAHKTGPLTNTQIPDPSAGPGSAHFELIPLNFLLYPGVTAPPGNYMTTLAAIATTTSLKVASKDPWDLPLINPNYLSSGFDRVFLRESIKATQRFTSASAWRDWIEAPFGETANLTDDEKIDDYVQEIATTANHGVGTASMSPRGANWGVVDPDLKVKGVEGLRVVDASVLPFVPSAHTQAPVYLIAERAADIIRASFVSTTPRDEL